MMGTLPARPRHAADDLYLDINFWEWPVWLPHRPPPQEYRITGFHIAQLEEGHVLPGIADHRLWLALVARAKQQGGMVCHFSSGADLLGALGISKDWDKTVAREMLHRLHTLHGTYLRWEGSFYSSQDRQACYTSERLFLLPKFSISTGPRGAVELTAQLPGQLLSSTVITPIAVAIIQALSPFALRLLEIIHKNVVLRPTWTTSSDKLKLKTGHHSTPDGRYAERVTAAVSEINQVLGVEQYAVVRTSRRHLTFSGSGLSKNLEW